MQDRPARPLIAAARRTAVVPRGGVFARLEPHDLAAPAIRAALADAGLAREAVDEVIFGNALGAGGNPARLAALAAGLPEHVPASSLDTQCCSGLDAVILAAHRVAAGEAEAVVAGGVESFSRAPSRSASAARNSSLRSLLPPIAIGVTSSRLIKISRPK